MVKTCKLAKYLLLSLVIMPNFNFSTTKKTSSQTSQEKNTNKTQKEIPFHDPEGIIRDDEIKSIMRENDKQGFSTKSNQTKKGINSLMPIKSYLKSMVLNSVNKASMEDVNKHILALSEQANRGISTLNTIATTGLTFGLSMYAKKKNLTPKKAIASILAGLLGTAPPGLYFTYKHDIDNKSIVMRYVEYSLQCLAYTDEILTQKYIDAALFVLKNDLNIRLQIFQKAKINNIDINKTALNLYKTYLSYTQNVDNDDSIEKKFIDAVNKKLRDDQKNDAMDQLYIKKIVYKDHIEEFVQEKLKQYIEPEKINFFAECVSQYAADNDKEGERFYSIVHQTTKEEKENILQKMVRENPSFKTYLFEQSLNTKDLTEVQRHASQVVSNIINNKTDIFDIGTKLKDDIVKEFTTPETMKKYADAINKNSSFIPVLDKQFKNEAVSIAANTVELAFNKFINQKVYAFSLFSLKDLLKESKNALNTFGKTKDEFMKTKAIDQI